MLNCCAPCAMEVAWTATVYAQILMECERGSQVLLYITGRVVPSQRMPSR